MYIIPATITVPTREDHDPGSRWPVSYRNLHITARASERHDARVEATKAAVARHYHARGELSSAQCEALAVILAMDVHGIGGPRGFEGGSAARMPFAQDLGKGRWNASDGPAYRAAAVQAAAGWGVYTNGRVDPALIRLVVDDLIVPEGVTAEWAIAFLLSQVERSATSELAAAYDSLIERVVAECTDTEGEEWERSARMLWRRYSNTTGLAEDVDDHNTTGLAEDVDDHNRTVIVRRGCVAR